jgi:DNA-binding CsgD family transcriptional regulator
MLLVSTYELFNSQKEVEGRLDDCAREEYSDRELICLNYLGRGMQDGEISRLLGISARTVRFHVDNVKVKLGASSRMQAVAMAIQKRLISV